MNDHNPPAIILLSGGLDSTTVLAMARAQNYVLYAMSFNYGQRHAQELEQARKIAQHYQVKAHTVVNFDLRAIGGSALTSDLEVPKDRPLDQDGGQIPVTYVPARNTIFLSFALAWAEVLQARDIFIGVNALDYSGYPDCRPEYIRSYEAMANLATRAGVQDHATIRIHTPLIHLSKAEIIREGQRLGVDYGLTTSCYDPSPAGAPCGHCDACQLRARGFFEAGIADPLLACYGQR